MKVTGERELGEEKKKKEDLVEEGKEVGLSRAEA